MECKAEKTDLSKCGYCAFMLFGIPKNCYHMQGILRLTMTLFQGDPSAACFILYID